MINRKLPPLALAALMLSLVACAETPPDLNYTAPPAPFAPPATWSHQKPTFDFPPVEPRIKIGTQCDSEYCTRNGAMPDLLNPRPVHRTDRRRQSDDFSTNQESDSGLFISGHW